MAEQNTPNLNFSFRYTLGESGWNTGYDNNNWRVLEMLLRGNVVSASTTAQPGSPSDGDLYLIPPSATGADWATNDGDIAYYDGAASGGSNAWFLFTPLEGMRFKAADTNIWWEFNGTVWLPDFATGITASTTQTQGQQPLLAKVNNVTTVANDNDTVTAPALVPGRPFEVFNNGANILQVFPASGENLGAGTNTAVLIPPGGKAMWICAVAGTGIRKRYVNADSGITASTTQTQGQQPLIAEINEVSVCATTNDTVTAPALLAGDPLTVINNGAQTLQVFPASGEDLGAGTDTAVTITAGNVAKFECYSDGAAVQII